MACPCRTICTRTVHSTKASRISQRYPAKCSNSVFKPWIFPLWNPKGSCSIAWSGPCQEKWPHRPQHNQSEFPRLKLLRVSCNENNHGDWALVRNVHRSGYIDFPLLLPETLHESQTPEIQLRLDDSSSGSIGSPVTMVRKKKPAIDTLPKWLDAYMTYMLVLVNA